MSETKTYFTLEEFRCKCGCGQGRVSDRLIQKLNLAREKFGGPMIVTSGYRCPKHNKAVGGKPTSAHLTGEAADLSFNSGTSMWLAREVLEEAGFRRIGVMDHAIHVDVSETLPSPALWGYGSGG